MKLDEFKRIIDELNLDKNKYCIIASGAMLMYGLREEVDDVDIKVTPELFKELQDKYNMKKSNRYDYLYELSEKIDVNCKDFNPDDIKVVNGYPVESIEKQLKWKLENNRSKDEKDIQKIREYLKLKN